MYKEYTQIHFFYLCGYNDEPGNGRWRQGSEKAYGFGHIGTDEKLFVFESPIDLLSYITAGPEEWEKHSYISLGGLSEKAMKQVCMEHKNIRSIYLCLDNDEPGNERCRQDAGRQKVCPIPLPGLDLPERNESCEIARKYLIEQTKLTEQV